MVDIVNLCRSKRVSQSGGYDEGLAQFPVCLDVGNPAMSIWELAAVCSILNRYQFCATLPELSEVPQVILCERQ